MPANLTLKNKRRGKKKKKKTEFEFAYAYFLNLYDNVVGLSTLTYT